MNFRWIFLVGPARSGTKFLRDTLAASQDVCCIPYDVGYVWRERQESYPDDALTPDSANASTIAPIRRTLERLARKNGARPGQIVIEKTVANSLRVDFIRKCFPEARFIFLERSGPDVIASAFTQWNRPVDRGYLLRKLRFFPLRSWRYGIWFVRNQFTRSAGPAVWGPRYPGIYEDLATHGVVHTVTQQYLNCVQAQRAAYDPADTFAIDYDDLAAAGQRWHELLDWVGISDPEVVTEVLKSTYRRGSGWPADLNQQQEDLVRGLLASST